MIEHFVPAELVGPDDPCAYAALTRRRRRPCVGTFASGRDSARTGCPHDAHRLRRRPPGRVLAADGDAAASGRPGHRTSRTRGRHPETPGPATPSPETPLRRHPRCSLVRPAGPMATTGMPEPPSARDVLRPKRRRPTSAPPAMTKGNYGMSQTPRRRARAAGPPQPRPPPRAKSDPAWTAHGDHRPAAVRRAESAGGSPSWTGAARERDGSATPGDAARTGPARLLTSAGGTDVTP